MLAVSIVVPVYNPGPNLARCMDSLLAQTMPPDRYEILCVDDGSTDGSGARLDEIATRVNTAVPGRLRVLHTPNSGWPGTPRNIGVDEARGEYIHFVDNDDILPPYTLTEFYDAAVADHADVVLGRPVSDFRGVNHAVYRTDLRGVSLAEHPELAEALTPHRMFRRELLLRHGIRFPAHRVPLEDHPFVLGAYLAARSITVLTGKPYYYYLRRLGSGRNAGDEVLDPALLAQPIAAVAELVAASGAGDDLAAAVLRRELRLVLLSRLTGATFADADPAEQAAAIAMVRDLLAERLGGVDGAAARGLGAVHRCLARAVAQDDESARVLAASIGELRPLVPLTGTAWRGGALVVDLDGTLQWRGEPLRCEPVGSGVVAAAGSVVAGSGAAGSVRWALPADFGGMPADRLIGRGPNDAELSLVHRVTRLSFGLTDGMAVRIADDGVVRVTGSVVIDPQTAAAGGPLDPGPWELVLRLRWEGLQWSRSLPLPPPAEGVADPLVPPLLGRRALWPHRGSRPRALVVDIDQTTRSLARVVADGAQFAMSGRRAAELRLPLLIWQAAPGFELLLEPGEGGLLTLRGNLEPAPDGSVARVRLPAARRAREGAWRLWLRLDPESLPAAEPVPLPWQVVLADGAWSARPLGPSSPEPSPVGLLSPSS